MALEQKGDGFPFLAEAAGMTDRCDAAPLPSAAESSPNAAEAAAPHRRGRKPALLSTAAVDLVAERFRILGEPLRVRIIQELQDGERSVNDLAAAVGASQPNVSKHLRIIQNAGIAGRRHDGNLVYYFITDQSVFDLCDAVCNSLGEKLEHDASLAAELHDGITRRK